MEKTRLIVEYLVAGTLIMISMTFFCLSYLEINLSCLIKYSSELKSPFINPVIVSTIFIAAAYAIGIVAEFFGERCFEWLLVKIKKDRVTKFIEMNSKIIENDPLFEHFTNKPEVDWDVEILKECIGKMRFSIMCNSPALYADISAQINRFRLIRVLFVVEIIFLIAVLKRLIIYFSVDYILITLIILASAWINYKAIKSRFGRYCRAVERSYLISKLNQCLHQEKKEAD